ncbi:NfeD family protein [Natronocalculus amylovorans]|uniref:NfeD family protein n=1 Tax=Natronocalculus amylovorans TaxID=2917812 RepID=A0AAE3FUQ7_9EURY|nr:NfeD family protein [Natronocalculus amylovorans]MCL9815490.1 NfeD family protein [Natronocalculus amylovorans]NUE01996.1 NfeD family protein [Halorubraceae archaeon YAN]
MSVLLQLEFLTDSIPLLLITAGLLISLAEAIAPGANFIVVGIALLGAGLVGLALGPLASPFILGIFVLLFGAIAFYGYNEFDFYGGKGQQQTKDSRSLRGKTGVVTERVTGSEGQIKIRGGGFNPYYSARSLDEPIPEGAEVMIVDPGGGNVVTVESLEIIEADEIDRELKAGRERSNGSDSSDTTESTATREREPEFET